MDTVVKCVGLGVLGAILGLLTRKNSGEFGVLVSIGVVVLMMASVLGLLKPVLEFVYALKDRAELGDGMISPVMKTLAIGYLSQTGKNICQEAGEKTVAEVIAFSGSVAAIYVLLPLVESVLLLMEQML